MTSIVMEDSKTYGAVITYLNRVLKINKGKLPKSTTCCWTLRERIDDLTMKQYFIGVDAKFAWDLSSDILKKNMSGPPFYHQCFIIVHQYRYG